MAPRSGGGCGGQRAGAGLSAGLGGLAFPRVGTCTDAADAVVAGATPAPVSVGSRGVLPGRRPAVRPTPKQEGFAEIVPSSWWASRALLGVGSCHALPSSLWAGAGHTRDAVPGVRGPCDSPARGPCRRLSPRRPRGCPAARPHTQRGHTNGRVADALLKVTHVCPSRPGKHMTPHVVPDKRERFSKHQNCRKLDSFPTFKSFWADRR